MIINKMAGAQAPATKHEEIMRPKMKELLQHLQSNEYTTEDVITIMEVLKEYGIARVQLNQSTTPESEALARWNLNDARSDWRKVSRTYNLPMIEVDYLY